MVNKITAPIGTTTIIDNPDLTAWILSGWSLIRDISVGSILIEKAR